MYLEERGDNLVVAFDIGTQSVRAVLLDMDGNLLQVAQVHFEKPYFSDAPNRAEQHADFYWEKLCESSLRLKEISKAHWAHVKGVSVTTIRDSLVCIDESGKPVRPVIVWLDKRSTEQHEPFPAKDRFLYLLSGMSQTAKMIRRRAPVNWIKAYEPDNWNRTHKIGLLSTYIHFKLCGNFVESKAGLIAHLPYNNKKGAWMKKGELNYELFPVEAEKLCDLADPGTCIGKVTAQASLETGIEEGIPLVVTGSDKGCETLGLGCLKPEQVALSFGTTATAQCTTAKYVEPQRFFPAYVSPLKSHYNPEIEVYRGYWLISWFKKEFAAKEVKEAEERGLIAEELLNERLKEIPPGCDGLILQPYFTPGLSMPEARGAIIGFSDFHTRIHVYRAIIEGINFALMEGLREMERRAKMKTTGLYLAGGGSRSREICQITADMFGVPAYRIQTHEAAVIGSAMVTFTSLGYFSSIEEASERMVHIKDVFVPDEQAHRIYTKLHDEVFSKVFQKLEPLYSVLSNLEGK